MKILVISSQTKSLISFRLDMMKEMILRGFEVHAIGDESNSSENAVFLSDDGIIYHQAKVDRTSKNIFSDILYQKKLKGIIEQINPDCAFVYQAKPIVYGVPILKKIGVHSISIMMGGLGSIFRGDGLKNRILSVYLGLKYKKSFSKADVIFFQNKDDSNYMIKKHYLSNLEKITIVNGSGVNTEYFFDNHHSFEDVSFVFCGRLIKDKGIIEFLEASTKFLDKYPSARIGVIGSFDSNPSSLKQDDLKKYSNNIKYYGQVNDVKPIYHDYTVIVLPSYHEGTPKSILEGMSMGKAIITTDAPGCRETVVNNKNGILIKVKDSFSLFDAMDKMYNNKKMVSLMGLESRKIALEKYDVKYVNNIIISKMIDKVGGIKNE